jgi:uncharacterized protein YjbI with pentapeptide repeats
MSRPANLPATIVWSELDAAQRQALLKWVHDEFANLSGANLSGANLSGDNLSGANLSGANLSGANLRDDNLSDANLSGANLRDADLSGANLSGADLSGANLRDADLSGANLSDANLSGTCLNPALHNMQRAFINTCRATKHGGRIVYRTEYSQHIGSQHYEPGHTYIAPVLSFSAETECHPGIYAASLNWMRMKYGESKLVRCYVRDGDWTITAKGAIRCERLRVLSQVTL